MLWLAIALAMACEPSGGGGGKQHTGAEGRAIERHDIESPGEQREPFERPAGGQEVSEADVKRLEAYFRNTVDFKASDLDPLTFCDVLLKGLDIKKHAKAWPAALKKELIAALAASPLADAIPRVMHGYYLVDQKLLIEGAKAVDYDSVLSGVYCARTKDRKGVVLLSYQDFVSERDIYAKGDLLPLSTKHVVTNEADAAIPTFIHETLHAIDFYDLTEEDGETMTEERIQAATLAWNSYNESRFREIGILALTDDAAPASQGFRTAPRGCLLSHLNSLSPTLPRHQTAFTLIPSAQQDAADLRYLAEETNFIAPYAMRTAGEDFAETVMVYIVGTRLGVWRTWTAYDQDLSKESPKKAKELYKFDARDVLKRSRKHRAKMCAYVALVFNEDCEQRLLK